MPEVFKPYQERVATVVGGKGALGNKITTNLERLGFKSVRVCEASDPFRDFVPLSTDIFFAVDDKEIKAMLQASRDLLTSNHSILDGSSVKEPLIPTYRELDDMQISVVSTHLGAVPTQPWRGIKVWVCEVGSNSQRAKRLAVDLFLSTNSSIQTIDIKDHDLNVARDQWITMAVAHIVASALRTSDFPLQRFDAYSTLNSELFALPIGRTLGQGTKVPSEVLFNQPFKEDFLAALKEGFLQLEQVLEDRAKLQELMQRNIDFHNIGGAVDVIFKKAGVIGARNANLRMHSLSFRIINDKPGLLLRVLLPFYAQEANLTAIDSMSGEITPEEEQRGVNPDKIVDFDIGIDPKTIDEDKERKIIEELAALDCIVKS